MRRPLEWPFETALETGMASHHSRAIATTGHPNASLARDLWIAAAESDASMIRHLLAPDVVWRTHSSGSLSGCVRGADAVIELLARSGEQVDSLTTDLIDIYASENGAVTHYRVRAQRGQSQLDTEALLVLRVVAGRVVEAFALPVDDRGQESFWLSH